MLESEISGGRHSVAQGYILRWAYYLIHSRCSINSVESNYWLNTCDIAWHIFSKLSLFIFFFFHGFFNVAITSIPFYFLHQFLEQHVISHFARHLELMVDGDPNRPLVPQGSSSGYRRAKQRSIIPCMKHFAGRRFRLLWKHISICWSRLVCENKNIL